MIHHVTPIQVLPLFPLLDELLIELLRSLKEEEWQRKTKVKDWTVKDIAAHLLDGNLRALSFVRDQYIGDHRPDITIYEDIVVYLDELNETWVNTARRLSPQVLTQLLETTGREYYAVLNGLDPWEDEVSAVAWAGEEISKNWFYMAREYTEKWTHQQQIREATGRPGLMTRELFHPFVETYMCALPQTYKYVDATTGTSVMVRITTDIGGEWHINKTEEGWVLRHNTRVNPNTIVTMTPDTAWRLFSKSLPADEVLKRVQIEGAEELGKAMLGIVSVMT